MTRLLIKWAASVLLLWAAQIVGLVVVPVALLHLWLRDRRDFYYPLTGRLPDWAQAWDSVTHPYGDRYWIDRWGAVAVRSFWLRFRWLALRNRAHNLSRWLGVDNARFYCVKGANYASNDSRSWTGRLWCEAYALGGKLIAWESYGVLPYPFTGGKWGIRWRLGWKIKGGRYEDKPHRLVCNVMPLRRIG